MMRELTDLANGARQASYILAKAGSTRKDEALAKISELLRERADAVSYTHLDVYKRQARYDLRQA